tara:strand:+ start:4117 stop:4719 length:603 start_codon:yes stop_codon:yes gene_type:complete
MTRHSTITPDAAADIISPETRALSIVQAAFAEDPPVRWLYPDDESYAVHFPAFAAALGAPAFSEGTLGLSQAAAALWIRPGSEPDEDALGALIERSVPGHRQQDAFAVIEAMDAHHPSEPHWYLPIIGTLPEYQGQGFGAALFAPVLEICDRTCVLAYLEATTERSRTLYARLGFETTAIIRAADCPPLTAMVRTPRRRT